MTYANNAKTLLFAVLQTVWLGVLIGALAYKSSGTESIEIIQHFTNWSWFLQILFYAATLIGYFWTPLFDISVALGFFAVNGLAWFVYALILAIIAHDEEVILKYTKDYDAGIVIIANDLFHVAPVIFVLLFALVNRALIEKIFVRNTISASDPFALVYSFSVYQIYGGSIFLVFLYLLFFDPRKVYSFDVNLLGPAAIAIVVLSLVNGIPYFLIMRPILSKFRCI